MLHGSSADMNWAGDRHYKTHFVTKLEFVLQSTNLTISNAIAKSILLPNVKLSCNTDCTALVGETFHSGCEKE